MDSTSLALFAFSIVIVISIIIDDKLSYRDFPSEFRQAWYTIFLGISLKWGFDLMLAKDWGNLLFVGVLAVLLIIYLIAHIKYKHIQNVSDRDYMINTIEFDVNKSIYNLKQSLLPEMKQTIEDAVKSGIKEALKEVNHSREKKQDN